MAGLSKERAIEHLRTLLAVAKSNSGRAKMTTLNQLERIYERASSQERYDQSTKNSMEELNNCFNEWFYGDKKYV